MTQINDSSENVYKYYLVFWSDEKDSFELKFTDTKEELSVLIAELETNKFLVFYGTMPKITRDALFKINIDDSEHLVSLK